MGKSSGSSFVGILLTITGRVLFVVCQVTNEWYTPGSTSVGIHQTCVGSVCVDLAWNLNLNFLNTVYLAPWIARVFLMVAAVLIGVGLIMLLFCACSENKKQMLKSIGGIHISAAVFVVIANAAFTGTILAGGGSSFGYSYYLAWGCATSLFIGGIVESIQSTESTGQVGVVIQQQQPQQVVWSTGAAGAQQQYMYAQQPTVYATNSNLGF